MPVPPRSPLPGPLKILAISLALLPITTAYCYDDSDYCGSSYTGPSAALRAGIGLAVVVPILVLGAVLRLWLLRRASHVRRHGSDLDFRTVTNGQTRPRQPQAHRAAERGQAGGFEMSPQARLKPDSRGGHEVRVESGNKTGVQEHYASFEAEVDISSPAPARTHDEGSYVTTSTPSAPPPRYQAQDMPQENDQGPIEHEKGWWNRIRF